MSGPLEMMVKTTELVDPRAELPRTPRLRLATLVTMRWLALGGQAFAISLVYFGFGLDLPLIPAMAVIFLSGLANVAVGLFRARPPWLGDREAAVMLSLDLVQLSLLLGLTGGLFNPFALLLLAPVAVATWALPRLHAFSVAGLALVLSILLAYFYMPLPGSDTLFKAQPLFLIANWFAIAVGIIFIATYVSLSAREAERMRKALAATEQALGREQHAAALGALAAAAAHELGSPLSTIAVVAEDLEGQIRKGGQVSDDLALLRSESARCREILARLSASPSGALTPGERVPLTTLLEEAAEPYMEMGRDIQISVIPLEERGVEPPRVFQNAWVVQGLRALIQNAVQFSRSEVKILLDWQGPEVTLLIHDDGAGFDLSTVSKLGDPYYSRGMEGRYLGGEAVHMGLGVFIARTLLSASGAELTFQNQEKGGGEVAVLWPKGIITPMSSATGQ